MSLCWHNWTMWRFDHHLTVTDEWDSKRNYEVFRKDCTKCGRPKYRRFR